MKKQLLLLIGILLLVFINSCKNVDNPSASESIQEQPEIELNTEEDDYTNQQQVKINSEEELFGKISEGIESHLGNK